MNPVITIALVAWAISVAFIWAFVYGASERRDRDYDAK